MRFSAQAERQCWVNGCADVQAVGMNASKLTWTGGFTRKYRSFIGTTGLKHLFCEKHTAGNTGPTMPMPPIPTVRLDA